MAMVRVEHEYIAREPDELTIHIGDIIKDVAKKSGGWWEGVLNDKRGVFPDNFVKVVESDSTKHKRKCKVIFNYNQDHEDELSLNIGDVVDILGEAEEGWWRGVLNGKEGVFPSNFVEEIVPDLPKHKSSSQEDLDLTGKPEINSPTLPPKPAKVICKVNYSYEAQNDDELSLNQGDIVTLVSKDGQDVGWWKGELNGQVGVFPDNFVTIITNTNSAEEKKDKVEKRVKQETTTTNPLNAISQRKSLELKKEKELDNAKTATPPVPGKKPIVPIKKSPSNSSSSGGLFSGLKKKIVDVVDGAGNSKSANNVNKTNEKNDENENAFDQVERNSLLSDVRATRAKAPGRRPPSTVFKEGESGIVNGNSDHSDALNSSTGSVEQELLEVKPKVREWEKHKVPWLEEMKFNQAKRTATSPGPEQNKLKLTPDKLEDDKNKTSPFDSISPIDMSKSMPSLNLKLKTPPTEVEKTIPPAILRNKPTTQTVKPISLESSDNINKPIAPKLSPNLPQSKTPSLLLKSNPNEKCNDVKATGDQQHENVCCKQYAELLDKVTKLQLLIEKQNLAHEAAIQDLKGKLQVETDMRMLLHAEVEKLSQCIMQV